MRTSDKIEYLFWRAVVGVDGKIKGFVSAYSIAGIKAKLALLPNNFRGFGKVFECRGGKQ